MEFISCGTYQAACRTAANLISAQIVIKPDSVLGLATGSTPLGVYSLLAKRYDAGDLDFKRAVSFNLDEYVGLSPDHAQSYSRYMRENLFDRVNFRPEAVHLPDGLAADPGACCAGYDSAIEAAGGIDLQLLGIGHNGHIGFNEPGPVFEKDTHVVTLRQSTREANARFFNDISEVPVQAVTMGIRGIMLARRILLMACGADKKDILEQALYGPVTPQVPASILQLHPQLTVIYSPLAR